MDADELFAARESFAAEVDRQMKEAGDTSPFPHFLNVVTDAIININAKLEEIDARLTKLEGNFSNHVERGRRRY